MAARISDRISARNLANDEPIQAYEADGVTVVDLLKVNASDQISIAVDGQDVVIGGTVNARNIATDGAKLDGIEVSADVTDTANVVGALTAGTNITIAANGTIASTDTNTTYSIGDGGLTTNDFTNADHTKLNGIATGANNYTLPAGYATETYVGTQISNLVDSSPAALNTLNELAAAIGDDANFSTTVTNNIATKLPLAGGTLTGNLTITGTITTNGPANTVNTLNSSSGFSSLLIKSGDTTGYSYLFFNDASAENARIVGSADTLYIQAGASATTVAAFTAGAAAIYGDLGVSGNILAGTATTAYAQTGRADNLVIGSPTDHSGITVVSSTTTNGALYFSDGTVAANHYAGHVLYNHNLGKLILGASATNIMGVTSAGVEVVGTIRNSTAPANYAHGVASNMVIGNSVDNGGLTLVSASSLSTSIHFARGSVGTDQYRGYLNYVHSTDIMNFGTSGAGRMDLSVTGLNVVGDVKASGAFTRSIPNGGYLEGTYNSLGTNSAQTNPIYIIGSAYQPFSTTLSNMYGVGYSHSNASFINFTGQSGWGMYVASDGDARIWLGAGNGVISSTGEHYVGANKVWHAGDAVTASTATALTAGNKTIAGQLTVGNTTSSDIFMVDTNEGNRRIHCNSNRIGFLNSSNGWSAYSTDAGVWSCVQGLNVTGSITTAGTAVFNGSDTWFRSAGQSGWYSTTYAGGMYMIDTTWVRVYNGKGLYVANQIGASGNISAYYSDERLKTKTGKIEGALEKVQSLKGFYYVENELARSLGYKNEEEQVALSAQDVQAVMPHAVSLAPVDMETDEFSGEITSKSGENYLTVDYARLVPLLVESIKELKAEIDTLKTQLDIS